MYSAFDNWETCISTSLRIFDPFSYRPVLHERVVPVSIAETITLAERWPVMWRRNPHGDPELVVLRSLDPTAEVPGVRMQTRASLPLLLQAYPFRFRDHTMPDEVGIDRTAPMRERDTGSYIKDENGNLLPGAELKLRALDAYRAHVETGRRVTEAVFASDVLEPVVLPDEVISRFNLPDFLVVQALPDDRPIFEAVSRDQWRLVARFLVAQRLSLYTMARLIALTGDSI